MAFGIQRPCDHCGEPCPQQPHQGRPRRWCSVRCAHQFRRKAVGPNRSCADCGVSSWGERCRPCAAQARRVRPIPVKSIGTCITCGSSKPSARHRYCEPCRVVARKRYASGGAKLPANQRGYGREHKVARAKYVAAHQPTDPCARCGGLLGADISVLDLDHTDDRTGYLGLSHQACNRSSRGAGALSRWPHVCDTCGLEFRSSRETQRFCSVPCYKAAPRPARPPRPRAPRPRVKPAICKVYFTECAHCDVLFAARTKAKKFCSETCLRGRSKTHECSDCGATIPNSRHKCDTCVAEAALQQRRRKRRKYRESEAGKRQRREYERRRAQRKHEGGGRMTHGQAA